MKAKRSGLTVVEMLVVVGIIAILVGLLLPAANKVRSMARETKQRVQFTAIDLGLATFKNDFGAYPPSDQYSYLGDSDDNRVQNTSGAQKLAEALLGWDLLGFHSDSGWRADGMNRWDYSVDTTTYDPGEYFLYDRTITREMDKRKDRYIDIDTANVAQLGNTADRDGLFDLSGYGDYAAVAGTFVLCDVFNKGKVITLDGKPRKSGNPILYYRADASGKEDTDVYHARDNDMLLYIKEQMDRARTGTAPSGWWNPLASSTDEFYAMIRDPRASTSTFDVPQKPDSYVLISAGADGWYGTADDICNFQR